MFEGGITWDYLSEAPVDEFEFLLEKAKEVNDKNKREMQKARAKMPRVRGRRR